MHRWAAVLLCCLLALAPVVAEEDHADGVCRGEDGETCSELTAKLATFRAATGTVRPPGDHGCAPVEVVPGLWTAHFHDIDSPLKLRSAAAGVTCVVNTAGAQCHPVDYGQEVRLVVVEGLRDDPDALKKVDGMEDGPAKVAARKALPKFSAEERAGDARKDFELVSNLIDETITKGGATVIHCHASLSRSVVFILAYLMRSKAITAIEAVHIMKPKWDAVWPNDSFVKQLIEYEAHLADEGILTSQIS